MDYNFCDIIWKQQETVFKVIYSALLSTQNRLNGKFIISNTSAAGLHAGVGRCASSVKLHTPSLEQTLQA